MAQIRDNPALNRFELDTGAEPAFVNYRLAGDIITLAHTEVPKALEGRGIGSQLARGVFDAVRARGLKMKVLCPFLRAWLERHPDYNDLVA